MKILDKNYNINSESILYNNVIKSLDSEFKFIFGSTNISNLNKNDKLNILVKFYFFWKDRIKIYNNSEIKSIKFKYCHKKIDEILKKVNDMNLKFNFYNLINLSDKKDVLFLFFNKYNTNRYEHINKMTKAFELYSEIKKTKQTFKVNPKYKEYFLKYNLNDKLCPEPCLYLTNQKYNRLIFEGIIKENRSSHFLNLILFHYKIKLIFKYYNYMYYNFHPFYGLDFINTTKKSYIYSIENNKENLSL
jgi:hypothetical protein